MKMKLCFSVPGWAVGMVLTAAMLFAAQVGACATVADIAQAQYDRGVALEKQGKHAEALGEWQSLLTQGAHAVPNDPQMAMVHAETLLGIGEAQRQSDQLDAAKATFTELISAYPQCRSYCADATIGIAKIYQKQEEHLKAIEEYLNALTDYPERIVQGDFARTRIYEVQKKVAEVPAALQSRITSAFAVYDKAKKEDEDITAARRAAIAKASSGDKAEAKGDLLTLFANPAVQSSPTRLTMLADAQFLAHDQASARVTLEKYIQMAATEIDPEGYRLARVSSYCRLGDYQTVITEGEQALDLYPNGPSDIKFRYYLAYSYDSTGQIDKAVASYDEVVSRYGSGADVESRRVAAASLMRSGSMLARAGRKNEAEAKYRLVLREYADVPEANGCAKMLEAMIGGAD